MPVHCHLLGLRHQIINCKCRFIYNFQQCRISGNLFKDTKAESSEQPPPPDIDGQRSPETGFMTIDELLAPKIPQVKQVRREEAQGLECVCVCVGGDKAHGVRNAVQRDPSNKGPKICDHFPCLAPS